MSPTSYRTAPPRVNIQIVTPQTPARKGVRLLCQTQIREIEQQLDPGRAMVARRALPGRTADRDGQALAEFLCDFWSEIPHLFAVRHDRHGVRQIPIARLALECHLE